jgi:alpha-L-fucosidase
MAGMAGGAPAPEQPYQPTWNSLKNWRTPQWLRDGKFGIYTHWGVYSVPAQGPNGTWFAHHAYKKDDGRERKYWVDTYGPLEKFGYKDFIPMFTGEKFNAEEWADLFQKSGARFAGPVAEHHDGFSMWDTKYSEWNAAKMGPKRDVVGELSKAIKKRDMKFVTAFHHAENWFFFPTWDKRFDCSNPRYSGLYGAIHEKGALPDKAFLDQWKGKIIEVIDKYDPDFVWFDFGLNLITDTYKQEMLAYYYNYAAAHNKEVVVSYKSHDLPPGVGLLDWELGQEPNMAYYDWITDTSIDSGRGWGYVKGLGFKSVDNLVDNLIDRVSKNGCLLLNIGPRPDGSIPEEAKERLLGLGKWLQINGDAIYGTTCWGVAGEGPSQIEKPSSEYGFNEKNDIIYTGQDIRFTAKDNNLYAIALAWPGERVMIKSLRAKGRSWPGLYPSEIASITMLGDGQELKWEMTGQGLSIETPKTPPCEHAFVFKIVRKKPF